jgi:DNA-binding PadR family transcriptional regulator
MTKLTNAESAILSLVAETPRHGYEIEQVIEKRGMRDWTEVGFSSIYYLLKKLEKDGLVEGQLEQAERGPARKVYRPTQAGWEALRDGVLEALSVPQPCYSPLQLGLANLPGIPPDEAIAALQQYRDALITRRDYAQARWDAQKPLPYFVEAMFDYSVTMLKAEIAWIEKFIEKVEANDGQD